MTDETPENRSSRPISPQFRRQHFPLARRLRRDMPISTGFLPPERMGNDTCCTAG
jgi:hypothetical protein